MMIRKWKHPDQYIIVFANKEDMQVSVNDHKYNTKHKNEVNITVPQVGVLYIAVSGVE